MKSDAFFKVLSLLQSGVGQGDLAEPLLECVASLTGAARGYVVVRDGDSYQQKCEIGSGGADRRFSRSLVRETIRTGKITTSADLRKDSRFQANESIHQLGSCSVLAAPLAHEDQLYAVLYLECDGRFGADALAIMNQFLEVAGGSIHRALRLQELAHYEQQYQRAFGQGHRFEGIVGHHPRLLELLETVAQIAPADAPVLIRGETGTGKELIAQAIHANSRRRGKAMVTIHCGALPETLFEAELFGHRRGAYTGADRHRPGRIAQAAGGSLFIDEVAEIPLASQAKLLRFFQFGEYQRLGSDSVEKVDVRIIAATHRNLAEMVAEGSFRADLYYRLNVVELEVPPLRHRKEDIPLLVRHFLGRHWTRATPAVVLPELWRMLEAYDYPGNVRELAHLVERCCLLARDEHLSPDLLPNDLRDHLTAAVLQPSAPERDGTFRQYDNQELKTARGAAAEAAVDRVERAFLTGLMARHDNDVKAAAEASGLNRTYLYRLLGKHKN